MLHWPKNTTTKNPRKIHHVHLAPELPKNMQNKGKNNGKRHQKHLKTATEGQNMTELFSKQPCKFSSFNGKKENLQGR